MHVRRSPYTFPSGWLLAAAAAGMIAVGIFSEGGMFHIVRLVSWALFLHAPLVLGAAAFLLFRAGRRVAFVAALSAVALAGIGVDAFWIEPRALEVNRVEVRSPHAERPFTIGVIADLQTDRVGEYERNAFRMLAAEKPDLILFPGDYVQVIGESRAEQEAALRALLAEFDWNAPFGAYAVQGNVDVRGWPDLFEGTPVVAIPETTTFRVNDWLHVTGLSFKDSFDHEIRLEAPGDGVHVVFGHGPDFALGEVDAELLVAGHTHGGQVQLPFVGPLITASMTPRSWGEGMTELDGDRRLVVSRGVGVERGWAPRLRFLCRPEIVLIDVVPESSAARS